MFQGVLRAAKSWAVDRRANVAVMTAICIFPLLGVTGLAIDYALAISTKAKLDMASDAAVVAAITKAKTVIAGNGTTSDAIAQGQAQGQAAFKANVGALPFVNTTPVPTVTIVPSADGRTLTANVSYVADSQNQFAKLFTVANTRVAGTSSSSAVVTPYYQFIFVVDVSGSMAIGGTAADILGLINDKNIGNGCSFACHDPNHNRQISGPKGVYIDPRSIANADGWKLKIDFVNSAITKFISNLKDQTSSLSGIFSVGIDTFATSSAVVQAPTTNLTTAQSAAGTIDIEPMQRLAVSQGYTRTTDGLKYALAQLNNIGDGSGKSPSNQATYIIFLSDGVEDIEGNMMYGRGTGLGYTSACDAIKNAKATLISIAAPYPIISLAQDPDGQYKTLVQPFQPPATSSMTTAMGACATGGATGKWAFQATDGPAIDAAVQQALSQILQGMTRLTQ